MDVTFGKYKIPDKAFKATCTSNEPPNFKIILEATGYEYEIDSLYEKLKSLYNKTEMMNTKHWIKENNNK